MARASSAPPRRSWCSSTPASWPRRWGRCAPPRTRARSIARGIAAKRLRYLIEPLRDLTPSAAPLLDSLKALQETSGRLHDAHVLGALLRQQAEVAAAARARRRLDRELAPAAGDTAEAGGADGAPPSGRGLLALAKAVRHEEERLFAALESRWLGGRGESFVAAVEELARHLIEAPVESRGGRAGAGA